MGDLLGSLAAVVAGGVIRCTGWLPIDPIWSIVVGLLILRSTWQLLRQSTGVLTEGVPHASRLRCDRAHACRVAGRVRCPRPAYLEHVGGGGRAFRARIDRAGEDWLATLAAHARRVLATEYGIKHTTLQPTWPSVVAPKDDRKVIPVVVADSGDAQGHHH